MPKKKIDTRLHDLFSGFDRPEAQPETDAAPVQGDLAAVSPETPAPADGLASLTPIEIAAPAIPEPAEPAILEPGTPTRSLQGPVIYERAQVGYAFTGNTLQTVRDSVLKQADLKNAILMPLTTSGQSIGAVVVETPPSRTWSPEEQSLVEAVAQQVSLQIQNLRLLASAERSRAEAQAATRRFIHESWDAYLDGIHQNERIGFAYDQSGVEPFMDPPPTKVTYQESVEVMDTQVGRVMLETDDGHALSDDEQALVSAVARQVGQQVENLRLLADAARARAEAEESSRRLTREGWAEFSQANENLTPGFVYDLNQVSPLTAAPENISLSQPLVVRGEVIGELAVTGLTDPSPEAAGLMAEIAAQASIHLETLRLNEELRRRAFELQELDRLKSSFLANMSHELRTPLNSILGFSDVILEGIDGPLTEYMENDLRLIQKNGKHLLHLINDVLDMAKIESGRMNLHPEKVKLADVFGDVINITSSLASEKGLDVFVESTSDAEIEVYVDVTRLRQVMINLVNNSIKFTESGFVAIRAQRLPDDQVMIAVRDTGIGIPPDHLETIFKEFSQVDTSTTRKVGGTGLGLPISRRLVEMHGGKMWAESSNVPGEGSTFYVILPREAKITEPIEVVAR